MAIDEPELHLHPASQRTFAQRSRRLLEAPTARYAVIVGGVSDRVIVE